MKELKEPETLLEAIEEGIKDGSGKFKLLRSRLIEERIREFVINRIMTSDSELAKSFRIFYLRIFGGKL